MANTNRILLRHVIIVLLITILPLSTSQNDTILCPLNFDLIRRLIGSEPPSFLGGDINCRYIQQGIRLVDSDYLRRTNNFNPPLNTAEACSNSYQTFYNDSLPNFDIRKNCTDWISVSGCMNITNRFQFENLIPSSILNAVVSECNQSLSGSWCSSCTTAISSLQAQYLNGDSVGNLTNCQAFPFIYTAAFVNQFGPTDGGTAACLFSLAANSSKSKNKHKSLIIVIVTVTVILIVLLSFFGFWYYRKIKIKKTRRIRNENLINSESALDSIGSTSLIKYTIEEIKEASRNFSIENIIGNGGFGNVYKGVLVDNTEVALKRFKNCSAAGNESFTHEVEVIASVRHVNLVGLRGYCLATTPFEGYQRIIVTELVKNGSLHDHLFGSFETRVNLTWPMRRKIALGMARGLAYLHYGAQTAIIHRDIKASNVLLDENFEAKVADFGLAKFTPEGATHVSTRVAGTMGYLAPEYALYGRLTERSDVYSFGVVLLELLSGKKALITLEDIPALLADWAWSMVRNGTPLEVIDKDMKECGTPEIMEKYVLVAVLSSHPHLHARPTMDQVLKMLDADLPVPSIPERPTPLVTGLEDIEKSVGSSGSGHLSTPRGYQADTFEMDEQFATMEETLAVELVAHEDEGEKALLPNGR